MHQAGRQDVQAVEEPGDLLPGAEDHGGRRVGVDVFDGLNLVRRRTVVGQVGDHQAGAGWQDLAERADDPFRLFGVADEVQHGDQQHRGGPGEVDHPQEVRMIEDVGRIAHVRGDDCRVRVLGEQCPAVREHDRVIVDVDDPCLRVDGGGDLVGVLHGRQARADVDELVDAAFGREESHCASEEPAVLPHHGAGEGVAERIDDLVTRLPVDGVVVLAAEEVVIHPRRRRSIGPQVHLPGLGPLVGRHDGTPTATMRTIRAATSAGSSTGPIGSSGAPYSTIAANWSPCTTTVTASRSSPALTWIPGPRTGAHSSPASRCGTRPSSAAPPVAFTSISCTSSVPPVLTRDTDSRGTQDLYTHSAGRLRDVPPAEASRRRWRPSPGCHHLRDV